MEHLSGTQCFRLLFPAKRILSDRSGTSERSLFTDALRFKDERGGASLLSQLESLHGCWVRSTLGRTNALRGYGEVLRVSQESFVRKRNGISFIERRDCQKGYQLHNTERNIAMPFCAQSESGADSALSLIVRPCSLPASMGWMGYPFIREIALVGSFDVISYPLSLCRKSAKSRIVFNSIR